MKNKIALFILTGLTAAFSPALATGAERLFPQPESNYPQAVKPVVPPVFIPLPLGAVEPEGWLRDWAVAARDGLTGHLDERHPVYRDGWKGIAIPWDGAEADGTGWPLEQSAYWMDGALRLGFILHDQALIEKIRKRIDPVVEGVNHADFGTSLIYWKKNWKPTAFNSWAHSQMGRALVALYSGTGEPRVLAALTKVYADYPTNMGGLNFANERGAIIVSGLCNLDAMMETYALSGDRRLLERAQAAIHRADVQEKIANWTAGKVDCGHLVVTCEDIRLPAVMYPWTGDKKLLQATRNAFEWLEQNHMLPYGLPSGEENVAGIGAARKTETCNLPAMLLAANWMQRLTGEGVWGDRMEKAFFNAGAAPLARDFQTAAYYQSPNRIRLGELPVESRCPGPGGISFGPLACDHVLCCIGACNRILPYFIGNMWMATPDHGLAATLYGPCRVNALAGQHVPVKIVCATDYPFNESIRLTVEPDQETAFPLYLRMPGWCATPAMAVNGQAVKPEAASGKPGFVCVSRTWKKDDVVTLTVPMTVAVTRGVEGPYPSSIQKYFAPNIPASLFQPRALPYACVNYGPLLFCLPIPDRDANTPVAGAKWQYALNLNPRDAARIKVERRPLPRHWDWPLAAPLSLCVPACAFDWKPSVEQALPAAPVVEGQTEAITLIPYGCAKFQISMFPVTVNTWKTGPPLESAAPDRPLEKAN